jgi:hypothetical protein
VSEERTPDELIEENELICERLLGWKKNPSNIPGIGFSGWESDDRSTPFFTTWAEAGLILDAFESRAPEERVDSANYKSAAGEQMKKLGILLSRGELRPLDIRAAGLKHVRGQLP